MRDFARIGIRMPIVLCLRHKTIPLTNIKILGEQIVKRKSKFLGILLALVMLVSLFTPLALSADPGDFIITKLVITDSDGDVVNNTNPVNQYSSFMMEFEFALVDDKFHEGDEVVFELPDELKFVSTIVPGTTLDLKDSFDRVVARATVDTINRKMTIVFTDYVDDPDTSHGIIGNFFFRAEFTQTFITTPGTNREIQLTKSLYGHSIWFTPSVSSSNEL